MPKNKRENHGPKNGSLELWGGIEATVNRIGDDYYDQLQLSGHYYRKEDIDLIARTGIKALRYPVLWEQNSESQETWWADERLSMLRDRGIKPIVGLVHHGSGPRETNLLDPGFVQGLGDHARRVAERYPWVEMYTPVNEPLTTARFSCLYGHWYPHAKDPQSFARALFIELAATRAAMREIRKVNPKAKLVQTEDMGKVYSTRLLAYQAEFENERRWLTFDLLCGRVNKDHPIWSYLSWIGISEDELKPFQDDPCPPDILGLNHYVTSERFLDERLQRYPQRTHGGNHQHLYADVAAVRACAHRTAGAYGVLKEAWDRYHLPTAITECHLGCTREEQLRWIIEVWRGAEKLRSDGADIRAVTIWSLLGAYDWDSLLTQIRRHYESGAFDLRSPHPRPTAIVKCMQSLAASGNFTHPAVDAAGWWRRPLRLTYKPVRPYRTQSHIAGHALKFLTSRKRNLRPLLITGATGTLGNAFRRLCELRGLHYRILRRQDMDICDPASVDRVIQEMKPWAVINTAGYVRVDDAETDAERCFRENTFGPECLAQACNRGQIPLVTFSSDLVFNGEKDAPYVESDACSPLNVYGASKAQAEQKVLEVHPQTLVIRTSSFFGPWDDYNFVTTSLRTLRADAPLFVAKDLRVSPTYVPDLVHATLDLLIDGESGVWHLANRGEVTWGQFARHAAILGGAREDLIVERPASTLNFVAARPTYSVLGSEKGQFLPSLEDAMCRYFEERREAVDANAVEKQVSETFEQNREAEEPPQAARKQCIA